MSTYNMNKRFSRLLYTSEYSEYKIELKLVKSDMDKPYFLQNEF